MLYICLSCLQYHCFFILRHGTAMSSRLKMDTLSCKNQYVIVLLDIHGIKNWHSFKSSKLDANQESCSSEGFALYETYVCSLRVEEAVVM